MTPPLPLIAITREYIELVDIDYPFNQSSALGVIRQEQDKTKYFDKTGSCWTSQMSSQNFQSNFLNRLLANTFYNPKLTVNRTWTKQGDYTLPELKITICNCVDRDDDILTQFVDAERLKSIIHNCLTFTDVVDRLNQCVFNPDEDSLWADFSAGQ